MGNEPASLMKRDGPPTQSSGTHRLESRSSGVVLNRLCDRCSWALRKSEALWQRRSPSNFESYFHSTTKQMLESIAAGCHLCTQVGKATNLNNVNNSERIMFQCCSKDLFRPVPVVQFATWNVEFATWKLLSHSITHSTTHSTMRTILASFDIEEIDDSKHLLPERLPNGSEFVAPSSTGSPEAFALIRHWLNDCLENHPGCRRGNFDSLPTRLIDIGQSEQLTPRICAPANSPAMFKTLYLTLSHSWALTGESLRLTTENIDEWQAGGIPLGGLAQTFRDAMCITQQLGYRYIWIDSLCIMQDSQDDWEREAHTMTTVYGNSLLTIFASGMDNADTCFSTRNPLEVYPCTISPSPDALLGKSGDSASILPSFYAISRDQKDKIKMLSNDWAQNPLLCRGWVLQERLLSCRIIHYGAEELYWECLHHMVSESYPFGRALRCTSVLDFHGHYTVKSAYRGLQNESLVMDETRIPRVVGHWETLVEHYTAANLTYASDRLVALAGVVREIEESSGFTYILGIWKEFLPFDLLWYVDRRQCAQYFEAMQRADKEALQEPSNGNNSSQESTTEKKLPSWSWAATEMPKLYNFWTRYRYPTPDSNGLNRYVWKSSVDVFNGSHIGSSCSIYDGIKHHGDGERNRHMATLTLETYLKHLCEEAELQGHSLHTNYDRMNYEKLKSEQYFLLLEEFLDTAGVSSQRGLIVMQTESDDPSDTDEVRKCLYSRVGMWSQWGARGHRLGSIPPIVDRSKEKETTIYLR